MACTTHRQCTGIGNMEKLTIKLNSALAKAGNSGITVGVVNSGNLEILLTAQTGDIPTVAFDVLTTVPGFSQIWQAVIEDFAAKYSVGGLLFTIHDSGATPAIVSLRLRQAYEKYTGSATNLHSGTPVYLELSARERIQAMTDADSFSEFLPPGLEYTSPHLEQLNLPTAFDDGIVIGKAKFAGADIFIAAQNYAFMGGAVGEINGAKLTGLCLKALQDKPKAVILLLDSGGVRLQEANAGEIAISEIIASLMLLRSNGISIYAIVAGRNGAFGGIGILSQCVNSIIVTENARTGISGAEVIEAVMGTDEYDASDRALVWRTCGGRERSLLGDGIYSAKSIPALKAALSKLIAEDSDFSAEVLLQENAMLQQRLDLYGACSDGTDIWAKMGVANPDELPDLSDAEFMSILDHGVNRGSKNEL